MGADHAIRVDAEPLDPVSTARALAGTVTSESPDLVLTGVQSADSVQGSTGAALAELVGLPRVAVVTRLDWNGSGPATVDRELEGGLVDVVEVDTPALLTIQTGTNQPRYANLRAIKQAREKPLEVTTPDALGVDAGAVAAAAGSRRRGLEHPERGEGAEMIEGSPSEVAARIVEIVRDRMAAG
jgi:electron transfer flavoprotein beta subunit